MELHKSPGTNHIGYEEPYRKTLFDINLGWYAGTSRDYLCGAGINMGKHSQGLERQPRSGCTLQRGQSRAPRTQVILSGSVSGWEQSHSLPEEPSVESWELRLQSGQGLVLNQSEESNSDGGSLLQAREEEGAMWQKAGETGKLDSESSWCPGLYHSKTSFKSHPLVIGGNRQVPAPTEGSRAVLPGRPELNSPYPNTIPALVNPHSEYFNIFSLLFLSENIELKINLLGESTLNY